MLCQARIVAVACIFATSQRVVSSDSLDNDKDFCILSFVYTCSFVESSYGRTRFFFFHVGVAQQYCSLRPDVLVGVARRLD